MKQNTLLLTVLSFSLALAGCSKDTNGSEFSDDDPMQIRAAFDASDTEVYKGDPVSFSNKTLDADRYEWDFGDGTTSTDASPSHYFTACGGYSVKLTAYKGDRSDKTSKYIKVTSRTLEVTTISATVTGKKYYPNGKYFDGATYKYVFSIDFKNSYYGYKHASRWGLIINSRYNWWEAKNDEVSTLSVEHYTNNRTEKLKYRAYGVMPGGDTYGDVFGAEKTLTLSY